MEPLYFNGVYHSVRSFAPVSGRLLGPASAGDREGRASPGRTLSPGGRHRHHAHWDEPAVVHCYNGRGTAEQWIKEGKEATHWTRLSRHPFRANEVRLLLWVIGYNLGNLLRQLVVPLAIQSWSLTSLQQRLFKTGGRLIRHARYFVLQLAECHLTSTLFREILGRIERLAGHPT